MVGLGVMVAIVAAACAITPWSAALEEDLGLSLLFHMRGPRQPPPEVAVVAIDSDAAKALGQPARIAEWPRALHVSLVDGLAIAGARVIAMDISFATPARHPADDSAFAAALERAGMVVLLDLLEQLPSAESSVHVERRLPPVPALAAAAAAHGPFPLPKTGAVRAYWLVAGGSGGLATLPVLAKQVYDRGAVAPAATLQRVPGDDARYLDFYGMPRTIATVGFHQVLAALDDHERGAAWLRQTFAGRAVFVGFSPAHTAEQDRVRDDYATVFTRADGLALSGVEIAATAFGNLLERRAPSPLWMPWQLGIMLAWGMLLGVTCTLLHGWQALMAVALAAACYLVLAHAQFTATAVWLPLMVPLLVQIPLAIFGGALWSLVEERRERRRLGAVIDDVLPPAVVAHLLQRLPPAMPHAGQVYGVFIMTDIEGFTTVAEGLSPDESARMLNRYFERVFPVVERHGGSVSDIKGDAILAFWFASGRDASMCQAACLAALDIAAITSGSGGSVNWSSLPTRIGVHAGKVTLARLGASRHHEYRAVGDAVNTASRIEALSKHLGTRLLASDDVLVGVEGILARPVGEFLLVGKRKPVRISELVCMSADATTLQRRLCAAFAEALAAYRSMQWEDAAQRWSDILLEFPDDGPSRFYLLLAQRCAADRPPPPWDAVVSMVSK